ncbi:MAG: gephyrin-like molybdotransferase Glp [Planctomycetota bacterium]
MIDVDEAQRIVLAHARPLGTVEALLAEALCRTLAAPIRCDLDDPPFDRSVMDGYAVRAADVARAPLTLTVVGHVAAGAVVDRPLGSGEAMQINTGAPIPRGADAVVRVEQTERTPSGEGVVIKESVTPGQFVTPRASYAAAGQTVLEAGALLTPENIGVAATAGAARVNVYRRPTVAVLATGDELVDIDQVPTAAQIRNSNQYILRALIESAHSEAVVLPVARDNRDELRRDITDGLRCDVLCVAGGVSMGTLDFVPDVLREFGATFHVHKMAIKPGRPTIFATMPDGKLVFALPGNPVGAFVGFELLVRPALAALQGRPAVPPLVRAVLQGSIAATSNRRSYIPARARVNEVGEWEVRTLSWQGSGDSLGMAAANALIMRPPQAEAVKSGDAVLMLLLDRGED